MGATLHCLSTPTLYLTHIQPIPCSTRIFPLLYDKQHELYLTYQLYPSQIPHWLQGDNSSC